MSTCTGTIESCSIADTPASSSGTPSPVRPLMHTVLSRPSATRCTAAGFAHASTCARCGASPGAVLGWLAWRRRCCCTPTRRRHPLAAALACRLCALAPAAVAPLPPPTLFHTCITGRFCTPSSPRTLFTASIWAEALGWDTSTMCSSSEASRISSSVARKAATSWLAVRAWGCVCVRAWVRGWVGEALGACAGGHAGRQVGRRHQREKE